MRRGAYLAVARAPFLILPVTLVVCGAGAAAFEGELYLVPTLVALIGLVALHMAVNILNEVSDFKRGIDLETRRTPFSGGSGALPEGAIDPRRATAFGLACVGVGLATGVWFLATVGWVLLPLLAVGAVTVLGYTDFFARHGLGEVAAGLGLGALPVMGTAMVQSGHLTRVAVAASLPAFFMTFNLLLLNEFPDEDADRRGGRRNLVLLLGRRRAATVYVAAAVAVPLVVMVTVVAGVLPSAALAAVLPSLLLFRPLRWAILEARKDVPLPALAANVGWILATNTVLGLALMVAATLL